MKKAFTTKISTTEPASFDCVLVEVSLQEGNITWSTSEYSNRKEALAMRAELISDLEELIQTQLPA